MRIGVVFPQTELGGDVGAVRAYGERVEELGFAHVLAYDHVRRRRPRGAPGLERPLRRRRRTFHEPFVRVRLPRRGHRRSSSSPASSSCRSARPRSSRSRRPRSTCSRAARFRLGVGLGWNPVEYEALGKDFTSRGRRLERADRADAPALDRAVGDASTARYEHVTGRGSRAAAGAATDPGVDRRDVAARVPPDRSARRRLVPAGAHRARSSTRRARSSRAPRARPAAIRSRSAWRDA